jgi:hypothetical protein
MPSSKQKPKTDAELIFDFAHGIEERRNTMLLLRGQNFVIFKVKGHTAWAYVGGREYVKTKHVLIRIGDWWLSDKPKREWVGRVSAQTLTEALRRREILKEVYSGDFVAPICEECSVEMNYGEGYEGDTLVQYYRCDECGWSEDVR